MTKLKLYPAPDLRRCDAHRQRHGRSLLAFRHLVSWRKASLLRPFHKTID